MSAGLKTARLEARCARIAVTLDADRVDDLSLLRSARILLNIHRTLEHALQTFRRSSGQWEAGAHAERRLAAMQYHLHHVLLAYLSLNREEIHGDVARALDESRAVLSLLGELSSPEYSTPRHSSVRRPVVSSAASG